MAVILQQKLKNDVKGQPVLYVSWYGYYNHIPEDVKAKITFRLCDKDPCVSTEDIAPAKIKSKLLIDLQRASTLKSIEEGGIPVVIGGDFNVCIPKGKSSKTCPLDENNLEEGFVRAVVNHRQDCRRNDGNKVYDGFLHRGCGMESVRCLNKEYTDHDPIVGVVKLPYPVEEETAASGGK